jgi:hypothetical protein
MGHAVAEKIMPLDRDIAGRLRAISLASTARPVSPIAKASLPSPAAHSQIGASGSIGSTWRTSASAKHPGVGQKSLPSRAPAAAGTRSGRVAATAAHRPQGAPSGRRGYECGLRTRVTVRERRRAPRRARHSGQAPWSASWLSDPVMAAEERDFGVDIGKGAGLPGREPPALPFDKIVDKSAFPVAQVSFPGDGAA